MSQIVSPPATRIEKIIDVDFGFKSGAVKGFTVNLSRGDVLDNRGTGLITLRFHDEDGKQFEEMTIYTNALAWYSTREGELEVLIDGPVLDPGGIIGQPDLSTPSTDNSPEPSPDQPPLGETR